MTPYFENGSVTLYRSRAEHVIPLLRRESFGCVILDPPMTIRTEADCNGIFDGLGIFRLLRAGGIAYTLVNPEPGVFVVVKGPKGERSKSVFSTFNAPISRLHGHPHVRSMSAIKGLLMSTTGAVLDPFCGIGTTLLMAKELGRAAVGVEVETRYCETAAKLLAA